MRKNCPKGLLVPSDGVDWDSGGESGLGAQAGRDAETKCLFRLEPGVLIHTVSPDPYLLTVPDPLKGTKGTGLRPRASGGLAPQGALTGLLRFLEEGK